VADFMRVRGFPFGAAVREFIDAYERIFVIEQNRDGQLRTLLINDLDLDGRKLASVLFYGGFPLSAKHVVEHIEGQLKPTAAAGATAPRPARQTEGQA
jgi:2-oxoglutarate ferredoxin oxidoreductase subunit alpha